MLAVIGRSTENMLPAGRRANGRRDVGNLLPGVCPGVVGPWGESFDRLAFNLDVRVQSRGDLHTSSIATSRFSRQQSRLPGRLELLPGAEVGMLLPRFSMESL